MESVGARLKKIRLEKGLSLQEVHKKTRVHLSILEAIEGDRLINFSPVYAKGFLKIYCKFLGLDPKDYIADYQEPQTPVKLDITERPVSFLKTASIKLRFKTTPQATRIVIAVLLLVFLSFGAFNLGKRVFLKGDLSRPPVAIPKNLEKKVQITKAKKKVVPLVKIIRLGIRAKQDCWIELKADGRLIFRNILRKGKFESWQAKKKIELSLGNAGGVELEVNGKIISPLGRRGQVIKNIVITREGLNIPR